MSLVRAEQIKTLLGKQVKVTLAEGRTDQVVAEGQLLSFSEGGEAVLRDEMGLLHYCWPMLKIEEA